MPFCKTSFIYCSWFWSRLLKNVWSTNEWVLCFYVGLFILLYKVQKHKARASHNINSQAQQTPVSGRWSVCVWLSAHTGSPRIWLTCRAHVSSVLLLELTQSFSWGKFTYVNVKCSSCSHFLLIDQWCWNKHAFSNIYGSRRGVCVYTFTIYNKILIID